MDLVVRLIKPIVMGAIMFGSVNYLTGSMFAAGMLALVPLLLGWVGVFTGPVFGMTGLAFIAAVGWAVSPPDFRAAVSGQAVDATAAAKASLEAARSKSAEPSPQGAPPDGAGKP